MLNDINLRIDSPQPRAGTDLKFEPSKMLTEKMSQKPAFVLKRGSKGYVLGKDNRTLKEYIEG